MWMPSVIKQNKKTKKNSTTQTQQCNYSNSKLFSTTNITSFRSNLWIGLGQASCKIDICPLHSGRHVKASVFAEFYKLLV